MKTSAAPALASWLLKHLLPGSQNEILTGDLLEQSGERGPAWYWRQVLAAIAVGFVQALRVRWATILFAIAFTAAFPIRCVWTVTQFRSLLYSGIKLPWPVSLVSEIGIVTLFSGAGLLIGVGVYLAIVREFRFRKLTHALLVGLSVVAVTSAVWFCIMASQHFHFLLLSLAYLPLFFGLLISVWMLAADMEQAKSKRIPQRIGPAPD